MGKFGKKIIVSHVSIILLPVLLIFILVQGLYSAEDKVVSTLETLPSNPLIGRLIFEEKGCIDCHGIKDFNKKLGPDLGKNSFDNFYSIGAKLWNHAPQMAIHSGSLKINWPNLNKDELDQLISFLFFLKYLGDPGDIANGGKLIRKKTCLNCHSIGKIGTKNGISLDQLSEYASPLNTAQVIWNHGPEMIKKMTAQGTKLPKFQDNDIEDISSYLREYSRGQTGKTHFMSPGNAKKGFLIFKNKKCISCHSIIKNETSIGPSLFSINLHQSVTTIAARMWNHSEIMLQAMKGEKIKWPEFRGSDMADLIAFLYFFDYYGPAGNSYRGKKTFENKSCLKCHETGTLIKAEKKFSILTPNDLLSTMWNHVPYMHEVTLAKNINWPQLNERDLRDLFSYLLKLSKL